MADPPRQAPTEFVPDIPMPPIRGYQPRVAGAGYAAPPTIPVFTISDTAAEEASKPIPWPGLVRLAAWICRVQLPASQPGYLRRLAAAAEPEMPDDIEQRARGGR